ncbi:hypothetical protein P8C59_001557 [Phyllachora maydis]|uniref:Peptidase S8/S53 domain-containing protein n=1 Tax=Phyllachora maydis TaxID=1825666 RepID=A0AAD9HYM5_9PEZI|nr:hypothetical protein P8C59_001557 [Phyllachora maydis]
MAYRLLPLASLFLAAVSALPGLDLVRREDDFDLGVPVMNPAATNVMPHRYIVVYRANISAAAINAHQASVVAAVARRNLGRRSPQTGRPLSTLVHTAALGAWRCLALEADDRTMNAILESPEVGYVEYDAVQHAAVLDRPQDDVDLAMPAHLTSAAVPARGRRATAATGAVAEMDAPSGLARLSNGVLTDAVLATGTYTFDASAGRGITVYVLDTGIRVTHQEFQGRAVWGANFVDDVQADEHGHGTHVAATIGGATYGVAKNVNLVAVKVLDAEGGGSTSGIIAGMQFVMQDVAAANLTGKAIMNMSIGGTKTSALNDAVAALAAAGIVPVVAAGNEDQDAANTSPASAGAAITVGAIAQRNDTRAGFSNHGTAVDIFAPGLDVVSASSADDTSARVLSGTSMATPHVAGLAAYLMALEGVAEPQAVVARIRALARLTGARVKGNVRWTTNLIAWNGQVS